MGALYNVSEAFIMICGSFIPVRCLVSCMMCASFEYCVGFCCKMWDLYADAGAKCVV